MSKIRYSMLVNAALAAMAASPLGAARADETPYFVGDKLSDTSYSGWAGQYLCRRPGDAAGRDGWSLRN